MSVLQDRRVVLAGGAALALLAGLAIAVLIGRGQTGSDSPPPASRGGLVVQTGRDDDIKLDPQRPLRCFVGGRFVGELPLGECARRNGVATGALDVGLDPSGALAAANGASSEITPLPVTPQPVTPLAPEADRSAPPAEPQPEGRDTWTAPPTGNDTPRT
jgi:hypothetical protein